MPKVAAIKGTHLHTIKIAKGVSVHLTNNVEGEDADDIRVTPEAFGKVQNALAYTITADVVTAIQNLAKLDTK